MKTNCFIFFLFFFFLYPFYSNGQTCNNWLRLPNQPAYVKVGDLDVPGNKITVEATFIRTAPWNGSDLYQGDLVSKHVDPIDVNYLLRPSSAEITTTNGYYKTPAICPIELNKTYHAAMVYDGTTLKFYRNGFLMSQVAVTGNMVQNNWQTQIGIYNDLITQEQFVGYVNEVRIWNIARTQTEIKTYMNQSLPSPQTSPGLIAYYTFDNLLNKQGNATWNGTLGGSATINENNSTCNFVIDSCGTIPQTVFPSFSVPDTVCVNSPVSITNTTTGASSYSWDFCVGCNNSNIKTSSAQHPSPVTYNAPGTYNINLTANENLPGQRSISRRVVVVAPPLITAMQDVEICLGSSIILNPNVTGATSFNWSPSGGLSNSNIINPNASPATTTQYTLTAINSAGCRSTSTVIVNVIGVCDSISIKGRDKICSPTDTVTYLIYRSANCTQLYNIEVNDAFATIVDKTNSFVKLVFKQSGTSTIKVTYENSCRVVADSLSVQVKFSPTSVNIGPDIQTCRDTVFTLHADKNFSSYIWQDGSVDSMLSVANPGVYSVTVQNLCGLQLKDTMRFVRVFPRPFFVSPLTATACKGDSIQFAADGGTTYYWSPAGNFENPYGSTTKALVDFTGHFTVSISDQVCRRDTTILISATAVPQPLISISKTNDVTCEMDSAILMAEGGVSYIWSSNAYITRKNGNRITVKPAQNTTFFVEGKDASGCKGQDSLTVFFSKEGDQKLLMPTAFSPNGDGLNDVIRPTFIGPSANYDFRVYNRWGQLVFHSKIPGIGWDGRINGTIQKTDVYVFYIRAEGGCNGKFEKKGTFVLVR